MFIIAFQLLENVDSNKEGHREASGIVYGSRQLISMTEERMTDAKITTGQTSTTYQEGTNYLMIASRRCLTEAEKAPHPRGHAWRPSPSGMRYGWCSSFAHYLIEERGSLEA
jgi:hypothetical protein